MHYPFHPTVTPGAPRPDLAALVMSHLTRSPPEARAWAHAIALCRETTPENFYEVGTEVSAWRGPFQRVEAADCAERILRNHRRLIHARWMNTLEPGDEDAWMCARRCCGLPT